MAEPIAKLFQSHSRGSGNPVFPISYGPTLPDQVEDKLRGGDSFDEFCNLLD